MNNYLNTRAASPSLLAAGLFALLPALAHGVKTESVVHETYQHFLDGELENVSLHRNGRLTLAPGASEIASLADAVIWSAAAGPDGTVYIGAGNEGKVYVLPPGEELKEVGDTEEIFVRAMAVDEEGRLYLGTSPDGKVYRIGGEEGLEVFFAPRETYIWSLLFSPEGDLFVGTGDQGRVYRIEAGAEAGSAGEVYFDSTETHISSLAWDQEGRLLTGTSPNGYVYRMEGREKAFLLFNSPDEEVRQIVPGEADELYVGTFSSAGKGSGAGSGAVAEAIASLSPESATGKEEESPPSNGGGAVSSNGQLSSTIYRVSSDGFHEPFWALSDVSIHSLLKLEGGPLLIGTGNEGRIFSLTGFQLWQLRQKLPAGSDVSAMVQIPGGTDILAFTSNPARVYRLDFGLSGKGEFLSEVFDAGQVARWGQLYTETTRLDESGFKTYVRSGNTEKADATWSSWSPVNPQGTGAANAPAARYFQYRLVFSEADAEVRRIRFFYRHANAAPVLPALRIVTTDLGLQKFELPPQQPAIDLEQLFRNPAPSSRSAPEARHQIRAYEQPGTVTIAWQARDGNDDQLVYRVNLRQATEDVWHTIGEEVEDTFLSFNGNGFPEGLYQAEVVASDRLSNPPGEAREARRLSEVFVIDNTAPEIQVEEVPVVEGGAEVTFRVIDQTSIVVTADYVLNGETPVAIFPRDGIFDAREEAFHLELRKMEAGRHTLLIRVEDEAGNARVHQVSLEVEDR